MSEITADTSKPNTSKPPLADKPSKDGFYWIRLAYRTGRYNAKNQLVHSWDLFDWVIAKFVNTGYGYELEFIGTDESSHWEDDRQYVAIVGPEIITPESDS